MSVKKRLAHACKKTKRDFGMEDESAFIELYDYKTDPLETQSLAGSPEQAERIAVYEKQLQQKIAEIAACKVHYGE